ncbi:4Fe-4S binding protein [Coriobacteriia bacterium Es71-Z0120]|uniref:4Fe-4S binding protein n=1 Tax=Parvivirga hydrogeniphila TaxID=2939460 RepID=UPI002260A7FF|nr:4Fe-4S binding protein [Parvivirga hydrogeniphila]MCL4078410.1 4Fe-4S binding protein [Parvivirga hydrogeniphila]
MTTTRDKTVSPGDRPILAAKGPRRTARIVRWAVLAAVLAMVTALGILHQRAGAGRPVGVDALCPFGGLETLWSLISSGTLVRRIALSSVLLLGATVAVALVFRRAFCGRICPLGFLQELSGRLGRRIFGRRLSVPASLDKPARLLKYVVLAASLGLAWTTADLAIRPYDPWVAYQHLTSPELVAEFGVGLAVLVVSLVGSLLYDRFFCKYACPMGAFLALISRFSIFKVRRNAETCIDCKACDRACPMNVNVSAATTVSNPECIDCGECVAACPVADTLAISSGTRSLTPVTASVFSVGLFATLIAGATAAGAFEWSQPTLKQEMEREAPASGTVAPGSFDVSLIKGSTTISEVVEAAGVPAEAFTAVYGVPASEQDRPLKELKDVYGCYPGDVRAFVELYLTDPAAAAVYVPGSGEIEGH